MALWVEARTNGFKSNLWGSYRQWQAKGYQVSKGAKAAYVMFYSRLEGEADAATGVVSKPRWLTRTTPVFNAEQVEGKVALTSMPPAMALAAVEQFVEATGAIIKHRGQQACYIPSQDEIHMPPMAAFTGTRTSTATEAYYRTLLHELVHWTGPSQRCDRDLNGRFGSQAYAMEELVAELGAAFLCTDLGITSEPRLDHAQYIQNWLQVLKSDKRAIFTAASKATQASQFLAEQTPQPQDSAASKAFPHTANIQQ